MCYIPTRRVYIIYCYYGARIIYLYSIPITYMAMYTYMYLNILICSYIIYKQYIICVFIYNIIQSTKRKLLSLAFGNRSEDTFFSLSTFCRRRRRLLLVFAHINSRATSINHSSYTRTHKKDTRAPLQRTTKNMGLSRRFFFPARFSWTARPHRSRRFVYFIINTNIANTFSVRLSDLHHLYRCQNKK